MTETVYTEQKKLLRLDGLLKRLKQGTERETLDHDLDIENMWRRVLSTKSAAWKYEDEVRTFLTLESGDSDVVGFKDFDSDIQLTDVILGLRCKTSFPELQKAVAAYETSVRIVRASAAEDSFEIFEITAEVQFYPPEQGKRGES